MKNCRYVDKKICSPPHPLVVCACLTKVHAKVESCLDSSKRSALSNEIEMIISAFYPLQNDTERLVDGEK
jgi:hypothetical protein